MSPGVKNGNSRSTTLPVAASLTTTCRLITSPPTAQPIRERPIPAVVRAAAAANATRAHPLPPCSNHGRATSPAQPRSDTAATRWSRPEQATSCPASRPAPRAPAAISSVPLRRRLISSSGPPRPGCGCCFNAGPAWSSDAVGRMCRRTSGPWGYGTPAPSPSLRLLSRPFGRRLVSQFVIQRMVVAWSGSVWRLASHWVVAQLVEASWTVSCTQCMFSVIVVCRD